MTTAIATLEDLKKQLAAKLQNQKANLPPPSGSKIRLKDKQFCLPDEQILDTLEVAVLGYSFVNTKYKGRYVPGVIDAPICWSVGRNANEMFPNEKSKTKKSDNCQECPLNEWGSDPNGGRGKDCKNSIRVAITAPDGNEKSPVYILELPPTSTTSFVKAVRALENSGTILQSTVVRFTMDEKTTYARVETEVLKGVTISESLIPHLMTLMERADQLLDRGFDFDD